MGEQVSRQALPAADIGHADPRFGRFEMTVLKQLDRDSVGRFDESHVPVARGAVDDVPGISEPLARLVDVIHAVSEVPEIAPAGIFLCRRAVFRRPVIGQLDFGNARLPGRGKKDQREAPGCDFEAAHFLKPDQLEKRDRRVRIGHADACIECSTGF